jgi:hypothetical protein
VDPVYLLPGTTSLSHKMEAILHCMELSMCWMFGWIVPLLLEDPHSIQQRSRQCQSFFSGHYQTYGINIHALCDAKECRFISVCIAAPGGCNDIAAFQSSPLHEIVQQLPIGMYIIGGKKNHAYCCCSEHLLTHFSGSVCYVHLFLA